MIEGKSFNGGLTEMILPQFISRGNFCFNLGRANSSLAFPTCEAVLKDGWLLKPAGRAVQSCSCFWWCLTALIDVYFGIEFHSFHANVLHAEKWVRGALGGHSLCVPG